MHQGTCMKHVPWCMPGSVTSIFLWSRWRGKRSWCMCNPQFFHDHRHIIQKEYNLCKSVLSAIYHKKYTFFVHNQLWICPIWVKIDIFFSHVTFKLDRWPWKTIGNLLYAISSFVHHFVPIGEYKLQLQSGNSQCGSKSTIFLAVWPSNLMDDIKKQQGTASMIH